MSEWKSKVFIPVLDYYQNPKWTTEQKLMFLVSNFYNPDTPQKHDELIHHIKSCAQALDSPHKTNPKKDKED